jgi:hypothetical protein
MCDVLRTAIYHSSFQINISISIFFAASPRNLDMVFVMDNSGSIGQSNFALEKSFVENLVEYFDIFPAKTRVAIVTYASSVKLEFNFLKNINKKCLKEAIKKIRYEVQ